ncbi:hypothetical protein CYY_002526 [Polysphondylium violaceum]|uniref:Bromo domain-containing protein n=1 Tax=Polysphondylium violaceum TaxID=133409 RepID=A0A8J4PW68_9MYCE|nr:hypothetical protein CYY_002526 [Polysphondylium violaceum]
MDEQDNYLRKANSSIGTLLLLHVISKYEIDKPNFDWSNVQEKFEKIFENFVSQELLTKNVADNIINDLFSNQEVTKNYYNTLQNVFAKNHINLEIFLRNHRKEELNKEILDLDLAIKRKISLLEQLKLEQQQQQQLKKSGEISNTGGKKKSTTTASSSNNNSNLNTTTTPPITPVSPALVDLEDAKKKEEANNKRVLIGAMSKVWKSLNSHRFAYIFRYPITHEDAPDYDQVIKKRMDLTTLKKNLDDGLYHNVTEFKNEIILIFNNAMQYNAEHSEIFNMANSMKKYAEKELEIVFTTEELLQNNTNSGGGSTRSGRTSLPSTPNTLNRGRGKQPTPKRKNSSSNLEDYGSPISNPNTPSLDSNLESSDQETAPISAPTPASTEKTPTRRGRAAATTTPSKTEPPVTTPANEKKNKRQKT